MRRRHLRVPAVGGEQYRRTRTKAIHVLSRVVHLMIIIIVWNWISGDIIPGVRKKTHRDKFY